MKAATITAAIKIPFLIQIILKMLLYSGKAENGGRDNKKEVDMKIDRDQFHQNGFKPGFAVVVYKKKSQRR